MRDDRTPEAQASRPLWLTLGARVGRALALGLFCFQFVAMDLVLRRGRATHSWASSAGPAGLAVLSACLWLALAWSCGRSAWRRVGVGILAGTVLAFQGLFHGRLSRFLDRHVARSALLSWGDVSPAFTAELPRLVAFAVLFSVVEIFWLRAVRVPRFVRPPRAALAAAALLGLLLLAPAAKGPPDLRLLDVVASLPFLSPERVAVAATSVPSLRAQRGSLPNVVLIVTESVRADEYCSEPRPDCPTAPEINALLPDRLGFPEMRATASYTVLSLSALVTGRAQNIPRAELFRSPTLFDAIKAVERDGRRPYTAYFSSHEAPMFPWDDPARSTDAYVTFETLFQEQGTSLNADVRLAEMFRERLRDMPSPFFAVLQFHDTHLLYGFDEARAPFHPWTRSVRWGSLEALKNAYRNAIHAQDRAIASAVRALREDPRWRDTVVLFTSDHGEAFGEHGAIHHGQNLFDEQIHVPAWIAHGEGALTPAEAAALRANARAFRTHLDVAPTVLDLFGLLDSPGLAPHVAKMPGRSLIRGYSDPSPPVPLTSCSDAFPCPFNTWGLLWGEHKLHAHGWDTGFHCDVLRGGVEAPARAGDPVCEALWERSLIEHPELPNGAPND